MQTVGQIGGEALGVRRFFAAFFEFAGPWPDSQSGAEAPHFKVCGRNCNSRWNSLASSASSDYSQRDENDRDAE
jgi:hypothetical protein